MKTIIATTALALSLTAPAFADTSDAHAFFALSNDSAAERIVRDTNGGDAEAALMKFAATKDSAAERNNIVIDRDVDVSRNVVSFFAMGNDSAAERIVN